MTIRTGWQPVTHGARTLIVTCVVCRRGIVNETNGMHRAGWQETRYGRGRIFRCGECASAAEAQR